MAKALSLAAALQTLNITATIALVLFAPLAFGSLFGMTQLSI